MNMALKLTRAVLITIITVSTTALPTPKANTVEDTEPRTSKPEYDQVQALNETIAEVKPTPKPSPTVEQSKRDDPSIYLDTGHLAVRQQSDVPYVAASILTNCHLKPNSNSVISKIREALDDGAKMIKFHLVIENPNRILNSLNESNLFKPFFWVRTTGRHATGLLLLRPEYDVLSLTTLELDVVTLNVNLVEEPRNCLSGLSYDIIEVLLRELVMNDFQNTSSGDLVHLEPSDNVCNMHVVDKAGTAEFMFYCCQRSESLYMTCSYLTSDAWLTVLFVVIAIIKSATILFSPRFIPGSFYRENRVAVTYIHAFEQGISHKMTAVITQHKKKFRAKNIFRLSKFVNMTEFKNVLCKMKPDQPYELKLNQLKLRVKSTRLLPEDDAPVGLFKSFYDAFFRCKIRERASVRDCCAADFFVCIKCHQRTLSWYSVLRNVMRTVVLLIVIAPWVIRIAVYFRYEHDEMNMRKDAAFARSLKISFPESFTLYLTPVHIIFIVIYILLSIESCIFGVLARKTKEKFKFVLRKCFQDMRDISKIDVFGWVVKTSIRPCTKFGAIGICLGLLTWTFSLPLILPILAFYIFPTLNVTIRLVAHFVVYLFPKNACSRLWPLKRLSKWLSDIEQELEMSEITYNEKLVKRDVVLDSCWKRCQQLVIIMLCLVSMYSVIFLMMEFVSFIVEVFVYTLMGLIVNASTTLTYISLAFLLGWYGFDCFGYVKNKYISFNNTLNQFIIELGKEKVEDDIFRTDNKKSNVAFRVKTKQAEIVKNLVNLTSNVDGFPRWNISRLVLFLTEKDRPMIPRGFFFDCCQMDYYNVPGELLFNYMRATAEFSVIILFLMFVLVVVMAFGETYELSATNKMLAAIAGGFLPFMLQNAVFKSHAVSEINKDDTQFQACIHQLLDNYEKTWPIADIVLDGNPTKLVTSGRPRCEYTKESSAVNGSVEDERFDKNQHNTKEGNTDPVVDLLIYVPRKIDQEDFPGFECQAKNEIQNEEEIDLNGSTSFLDG